MSHEAYNRSGWGKLSDLGGLAHLPAAEVNFPRRCELSAFDDALVKEVIDSLRREISMLERRLTTMEE